MCLLCSVPNVFCVVALKRAGRDHHNLFCLSMYSCEGLCSLRAVWNRRSGPYFLWIPNPCEAGLLIFRGLSFGKMCFTRTIFSWRCTNVFLSSVLCWKMKFRNWWRLCSVLGVIRVSTCVSQCNWRYFEAWE